jgi:isopenicillin-N N-acyltransferase like protein
MSEGMFPVVEVSGKAFERGRMHGEQARGRIERSIANYAHLFAFCEIAWDEAQQRALAYRDAIGALDAGLLEEIEGIAAGAGRKPGEILALNARTELLPPTYLGKAGGPSGECTAIAVQESASDRGTLLAQNWDWLGAQRDALILLRVPETDRPGFLTLTEAGMLAKIGMNTLGFGVCLNILRSVEDGRNTGVPVHVLLRALLACSKTVAEATAFATRLSFGASSNVLCADVTGEAASLEISPLGVRVLHGASGTLCHTNHFIAPDTEGWQLELADNLSTEPRLARARRHAAALGVHGVEDLKTLLRDESDGFLSICRRPDPSLPEEARIETVASVIMELAHATIHVAPDIPSLTEYRRVSLAPEPVLAA